MSLRGAIEAYLAVLGRYGEVLEFDLSALDRLDVPVTTCSLAAGGRLVQHGNGYGPTAEAARLSGLGELAEGVLAGLRVAELRRSAVRASRRELLARRGAAAVADPRLLCLPAGSAYDDDLPLEWVTLQRVRTGEEVAVPVDFVASEPADLPGADTLITPVSNGLGAGTDVERALGHGLGEVLQRHTNGLRFRALDRLSPEIAADGLPAGVAELVDRFRSRGVEPVLKHAATAYGVCSTYATGTDADPGARVVLGAAGEAAHPDAEVSLTKALLEFANSRARKAFFFGDPERARAVAPAAYLDQLDTGPGEPRAVQAMAAWADLDVEELRLLTAPSRRESVAYADVVVPGDPHPATPAELLQHLLGGLADHDVLAATVEVDGVHVAKVVVPGTEVETLSYGRIGEAGVRAALAADLDLVRLQPGPSASHPDRVCLTADAEERLGGPAWYSYAVAERLVGPLYPLYREPPRHAVAV